MAEFFAIATVLCLSTAFLIVWPLLVHPTLPLRRRILLSAAVFFVLVPMALLLYAWLGVPQMAVA